MYRRTHWIVIASLLVLLFVVPSASAQSQTLRWHRWDSDIWVNSDGTFTVQEEYEVEFVTGEFTFGYRNIPFDLYESIRDIRVREGAAEYQESRSEQANTFYWIRSDDEYVINWYYPPTSNMTRVFTVEYTVVGGLFISEELGDRIFWKAVGPEHAFPIESSTVVIHVPPGATVDTTTDEPAAFGPSATITIADDRASVTYFTDYIPADQEFEVGVYFPHGFVPAVQPSWQADYEKEQAWKEGGRPIANLSLIGLGLLLLVGGPLGIYLLWLLAGRDPKVGAVPDYLSEPPSDLPPGLAGTLVDEKADLQDIIATLVDLARRGAIEMKEQENKLFGIALSKEFVFRKKDDFSGPLREYESLLLKEMFGRKTEIELDDLREKFYTAIPKLQKELYKESVEAGFFPSSPKSVRGRYLGLGIAGLVLSMGLGFCVTAALVGSVEAILCPFVSLGFTSIVLIIVSRAMPFKTREGALEAAKWEAFRTYLKEAERYTDLEGVTDQFDRYLPYAIAFGLERAWINKFSRVTSTPMPGWYIPLGYPHAYGTGGHGGTMSAGGSGGRDLRGQAARPAPSLDGMSDRMLGGLNTMSSGLFSMLNSTSRVFTSVPHSSGSSGGGFSGGGFSGGFSGGGGGGGGGAGFG